MVNRRENAMDGSMKKDLGGGGGEPEICRHDKAIGTKEILYMSRSESLRN